MSSPAAPGTSPPEGRPARARHGALDMVRSLLVVLAGVVALLLLVPRPEAPQRTAVDVAGSAEAAQDSEAPVVVPDVPATWTANAARVELIDGIATWHVGYVTPGERYAGLRLAEEASGRWLGEVTGEGREVGRQTVDGRVWRELLSDDGRRRSLVLDEPAAVTVVTGTAPLDELAVLARAVSAGR